MISPPCFAVTPENMHLRITDNSDYVTRQLLEQFVNPQKRQAWLNIFAHFLLIFWVKKSDKIVYYSGSDKPNNLRE